MSGPSPQFSFPSLFSRAASDIHRSRHSSASLARRPDNVPFFGFAHPTHAPTSPRRAEDPRFDIFVWYPKYQSCQRYFLDHAQHSGPVLAVAAFINILLPSQRHPPIGSSSARVSMAPLPPPQPPTHVSLVPYIRRLIVTGYDNPAILHGFFGDDWRTGIGTLHEAERRNYLFAAKSGGWAAVKKEYDIPPMETVPFMRPLQGALDTEIKAAERTWSEWLAMEDWMVGPRAPDGVGDEMDMGGVGLGLDMRLDGLGRRTDEDGFASNASTNGS